MQPCRIVLKRSIYLKSFSWIMKPIRRKICDINGSRYALIPFYIAEPYGIEGGARIEFDTTDSETLVIKIKKGGRT